MLGEARPLTITQTKSAADEGMDEGVEGDRKKRQRGEVLDLSHHYTLARRSISEEPNVNCKLLKHYVIIVAVTQAEDIQRLSEQTHSTFI